MGFRLLGLLARARYGFQMLKDFEAEGLLNVWSVNPPYFFDYGKASFGFAPLACTSLGCFLRAHLLVTSCLDLSFYLYPLDQFLLHFKHNN
jgi:hypothetical protein